MKSWTFFSQEDINAMSANPKPIEDNSERKCPQCGEKAVRMYYREINISRLIGASWYWCHNCYKYIHFSGAPRSKDYEFSDPIAEVSQIEGNEWYDYLDSLWDKGILPQVFIRKSISLCNKTKSENDYYV